jgi:hypothetical protein
MVSQQTSLLVAARHMGSKLVDSIRVPYVYVDQMAPDFIITPNMCILYASLNFVLSNPGGFRDRLVSVAHRYSLCVVLIHVDDEAAVRNLPRLNSQCLFHFCTLICVFSLLEVGLYLESVVSLSDRCMSQNISSTGSDFLRVSIILNGLKHVGKNDICSLLQNFNTLSDIFRADESKLSSIPGMGNRKVQCLMRASCYPFVLK